MVKENSKSVCEEAVYAEVFRSYSGQIRNFILYKCGDYQQAEDIVQEAFVRLWNNCSNVSIEKAKSFLYTVSNNLFLNEVNHQKVVLKFKQKSIGETSAQDPAFLLEEKELKLQLEEAISELPDGQKEVFLLNRMDKKTYAEIADLLGISVKAVEKRMHKALVKLRVTLKKI